MTMAIIQMNVTLLEVEVRLADEPPMQQSLVVSLSSIYFMLKASIRTHDDDSNTFKVQTLNLLTHGRRLANLPGLAYSQLKLRKVNQDHTHSGTHFSKACQTQVNKDAIIISYIKFKL